MVTRTVATDFSFSHLQRTPGQAPEWHIFGQRPGIGGTEGRRKEGRKRRRRRRSRFRGGGGGQSHVADVGKQYPALSWHCGRLRTLPEISGARATHRPGQKVDSRTAICIHTHTHAGRNTQTANRQIKDSLSVSATQQLLQFPWQQLEQCTRKVCVG